MGRTWLWRRRSWEVEGEGGNTLVEEDVFDASMNSRRTWGWRKCISTNRHPLHRVVLRDYLSRRKRFLLHLHYQNTWVPCTFLYDMLSSRNPRIPTELWLARKTGGSTLAPGRSRNRRRFSKDHRRSYLQISSTKILVEVSSSSTVTKIRSWSKKNNLIIFLNKSTHKLSKTRKSLKKLERWKVKSISPLQSITFSSSHFGYFAAVCAHRHVYIRMYVHTYICASTNF